jgi:N-methylhydantoinase A
LFVFSLAVVGTAAPSTGRVATGGARAAGRGKKGGARGKVCRRQVWFDDDFYAATIVDRTALGPAESVEGPAVVQQFDSTVVVPPAWSATVDPDGNLLARRER